MLDRLVLRSVSLALGALWLASGLGAQSGHPTLVLAEGFEIGSATGWSGSWPATEVCARPIDLVDVSSPASIVGNGTPASCNQAAFQAAVAGGGVIVFDCGPNPHTIALSSETEVDSYTVIDGGGLVTLDGQGVTRILAIHSSFELLTPHLVVQRLTLRNGASFGPNGDLDFGGGAIFRLGGRLWILDSEFYDNSTTSAGNDVGGGAVYSVGSPGETIVVGTPDVVEEILAGTTNQGMVLEHLEAAAADELGGSAQPLARGQHPDYWHYVLYDGAGHARGSKRPRRETGLVSIRPMTGFYPPAAARPAPRTPEPTWSASKSRKSSLPSAKPTGNDLSTPVPEIGFPGLQSLVPGRHALEGGARC